MMKTLWNEIRISFVAIASLSILLCGLYPFLVWGVGALAFSHNANGSLIENKGQIVGSEWIGQNFTSPKYFQSRPSAAGKGYDAANSSGSNLGPTSKKWLEGVTQNIANYRQSNQLAPDIKIPADAVTASASGLDPHISPRNAELQAERVAQARSLAREKIQTLIVKFTESRTFGIFGEERVNVVKLNLALDQLNNP